MRYTTQSTERAIAGDRRTIGECGQRGRVELRALGEFGGEILFFGCSANTDRPRAGDATKQRRVRGDVRVMEKAGGWAANDVRANQITNWP